MAAAVEAAGRNLGVRVTRIEIRTDEDMDGAFQTAVGFHLQALIVPASRFTSRAGFGYLADLATTYRLLTVGPERAAVLAYSADTDANRRRAAVYVDRILKGAKPADLPVEEPTKFRLIINVKLARDIGVSIPQAVLAQATEIIE